MWHIITQWILILLGHSMVRHLSGTSSDSPSEHSSPPPEGSGSVQARRLVPLQGKKQPSESSNISTTQKDQRPFTTVAEKGENTLVMDSRNMHPVGLSY